MGIIEGTRRIKTVIVEYDFAVDGGAVGAIVLRGVGGAGNQIPAGAVITGGYLDITTAVTSGGSATVALGAESATDILAATAVASLTAGRKSIVPAGTGVTTVKTTVARSLTATIAVADLTAGVFRLVVNYL